MVLEHCGELISYRDLEKLRPRGVADSVPRTEAVCDYFKLYADTRTETTEIEDPVTPVEPEPVEPEPGTGEPTTSETGGEEDEEAGKPEEINSASDTEDTPVAPKRGRRKKARKPVETEEVKDINPFGDE
jgi:hypothetical protein